MLTLDTTGEKQWAADLQVFLQFLAWSTIYIPFCNEEILVWAQGLAIIALTYYAPFPGLRERFSSRSRHLWVLAFILYVDFFPPVECCLSQNSISDGKTVRCPKCKVVYRKHIMWHCEERMESSHKNTATC